MSFEDLIFLDCSKSNASDFIIPEPVVGSMTVDVEPFHQYLTIFVFLVVEWHSGKMVKCIIEFLQDK